MKRKTLLFILLMVAVVAGATGYYIYNRPPETVDDQKGTAVTAEALTLAYTADEAKANTQYLNKVLSVSGVVSEISKNQDGQAVILLQSDDPLSGVQCTMKQKDISANPGERITVKGFCTGYTMVALLSECILEK